MNNIASSLRETARLLRATLAVIAVGVLVSGCSPKVGSEDWCTMMNDKPKGDWSGDDAAAYTKHCVLGLKP